MTKKILTIAAGLLLATAVHAEQFNDAPKNEVSVSYGVAPLYAIGDAFANALASGIVGAMTVGFTGEIQATDKTNFGVINFDYNHHFSPAIAVGINLSYSSTTGDINTITMKGQTGPNGTVYTADKTEKIGDSKGTYYTVMPTIKFDWFRREHLSMYSRVSAGVLFARTKDHKDYNGEQKDITENKTVFELQCSPFGIEGGGNHLRAFAEVGIGQCGIAQLGVRARF